MKKIIISLGVLFLAVSFSHAQSPFLTWRFANPTIIEGTPDTLMFEVQVKCDVGTTYHTDINVYLNYNTDAFGSNAVANGKVSLKRATLTEEMFSGFYKYDLLPIGDVTSSKFAFGTEPFFGYNAAFLTLVPTTFTPYMKVKMAITDNTEFAGITFDVASMNGAQYYLVGTLPVAYGTNVIDNSFASLPLDPNTSLIISEVADPSNSSANFVEIYNAGASSVNFSAYYSWFLNFNGSSSVQLTGTLAAGGKFVVAENATNFNTAYPGKSYNQIATGVGTLGTTDYLLTTYGDYASGTSIDAYSGLDFVGSHAVRHYNIVTPNSTTTASEWVISPAEDMDMTPGSHRATLTWDGSANDAWRNQSNWSSDYIPDAAHNVTIPNAGETLPTISNGENAYCNNLTIGGTGEGMTIISDQVDGDGSFINYGTQSGTGTASVQRFLDADRYWYVSQPVTSATAGVFLHTWMFTYDETAGDWDEFIEPETTPISVMKGYAVWTSSVNPWHQGWDPVGDTTVAYTGTLNTGAVSTPLTRTSVGSSYGDGWNFTGNPYPSAVDWDAASGWTKTNLLTNSYSVWNGTTYGTYTTGSGGTNGTTRYIPAAQGFFVRTSAAGTLGANNSVRTHSTQDFFKSDDNMMNRLSLIVSNEGISDETVIYFNENATTDLDYTYDANKLMAPAASQLYTMLGSERMAINTFNNITETSTVKLGVNAPATGEYTISASNIESFDANTPIYLEDLVTGQVVNLRQTGSYTFSSDEGTAERFVVHFSEVQGIGDPANNVVNGIYSVDNNVYVNFTGISGEIALYNILGQEISRTGASNGLNILPVQQGNSVYIVKVISDNTTVTKKVFVK